MSLFSFKNVRFKDFLHYPDIEIAQGKLTFLCGESGCGKSTLLKLLNAAISASAGEILYEGRSLPEYDPIALRREVLLCGQSVFLFEGSIMENFTTYYQYRDLTPPSRETVQMYLKICAADFALDTVCATMSGGERARIFLAICLSLTPKVLLLDEPTAALDDATADLVMGNLKAFCQKQGMTLVVVSHSNVLVTKYADAMIRLARDDVN